MMMRRAPIALLGLVTAIVTQIALAQDPQPQPTHPQPTQPQAQPQPQPTNTGTCWGFGCDKQTTPTATATTPPPQPTTTSTIPYVAPPPTSSAPLPKDKPTDDDDDDRRPDVTKASVKLEMGATYRRIYGFDAVAMDGRFGVGARSRKMGHYFVGGFFWGEMTEHLRTYSVTFGYNLEIYPIEPLRLGFGIEPGFLWIRRASYDSRLFAPGIEAFAHGGADIIKLGQSGYHAMYIDIRLQAGIYLDNAPMWGPTLSLGFRF